MKTSKLKALKNINRIILCAGHGAGDSGATNGKYKEAEQVITICNIIQNMLESKGVEVVRVKDSLGLKGAINWVNSKYKTVNSGWAIEIHRDSFASAKNNHEYSNRMGVYWDGDGDRYDAQELNVAKEMEKVMEREGAVRNTWVRNGRYLAWVGGVKPLSHLVECGFMQGSNSTAHIKELARRAGVAIYEAFTGQLYSESNNMFKFKIERKNGDQYLIATEGDYRGEGLGQNLTKGSGWGFTRTDTNDWNAPVNKKYYKGNRYQFTLGGFTVVDDTSDELPKPKPTNPCEKVEKELNEKLVNSIKEKNEKKAILSKLQKDYGKLTKENEKLKVSYEQKKIAVDSLKEEVASLQIDLKTVISSQPIEKVIEKIEPVKESIIPNKLKSRKLWATVFGIAYAVVAVFQPELQVTLVYVEGLVVSYTGWQGLVDASKNKAKDIEKIIKSLLAIKKK